MKLKELTLDDMAGTIIILLFIGCSMLGGSFVDYLPTWANALLLVVWLWLIYVLGYWWEHRKDEVKSLQADLRYEKARYAFLLNSMCENCRRAKDERIEQEDVELERRMAGWHPLIKQQIERAGGRLRRPFHRE